MFCLEPIKSTELAFNPIGCHCVFKSHGTCLQAWFQQKQQLECPICHTVSMPSPVQPVALPAYQIVYVQEPPQEMNRFRITRGQQKCAGYCCIGFLLWWVALSIFEFAIKK